MQVLTTKTTGTAGRHLVFMFGVGMIGSAIRDALLDNGDYRLGRLAWYIYVFFNQKRIYARSEKQNEYLSNNKDKKSPIDWIQF